MKQNLKKQSLFSTMFPVPKFLSFDPVGIDISLTSVRAIRLKKTKYGLIPEKYFEVILKEKCEIIEKKEDLENCEELRNALRFLKKEMNLKYVYLSLPEYKTYIFNTILPLEALKSIDDALIIKIQENIPLDISEIVYDYSVVKVKKDKLELIVTAIPKNIIELYTKLSKEEGLIPFGFESESQSIARAVIEEGDKVPYLIVNFGHAKISFSIVQDGFVYYTSSLPYSAELICNDFFGQESQILKSTLNKLLVYWFTNKHNPDADEKITNLIITGFYATTPGLSTFLEQHLHVNVIIANVWKNCFDINNFVPELDMKTSLQYNTAIGLTLIKKDND